MYISGSDNISKLVDFSAGNEEMPASQNLRTHQACIIFGVGQDPAKISAFTSWAADEGVKIKALVGKYEGRIDHCFIAPQTDYSRIKSFLHKEESVLLLDRYDINGTPRARLVYYDGREEEKGKFQSISKDEANQSWSWTFDPINGNYFTTVALEERN
jgi:hypothetical protein